MTYDQLVARCKELRGQTERAAAKYFLFLMEAETRHASLWQEAGHTTFDTFLNSNTLCKTDRYHLFKKGVEKTSVDEAIKFGASWVMANGHESVTATITAALRERADAFVEVGKVAPAEETVKGWRAEATPPSSRPPSIVQHRNELQRLRAENMALKAKLKAAEKQIEDLEKQLGRKKGKVA